MASIGPVELAVAVLLVLVLVLLVRRRSDDGRRSAAAFARRAGLPEVTPELVRRVRRRRRFVVAGTLLGLLATGPLDLFLVPVYAGLALGAVADAVTRPGPPPGTPRVAHAASTRLGDYVPPWLLGAAFGPALCLPLLALLWLLAPHDPEMPMTGIPTLSGPEVAWLLAGTAAGVAASALLARVVVRRPQPAGSPAELAVDDALRAQAVRDVLQVTAVASFAAGWVLSVGLVEPDVFGLARRVGGAFPLVFFFGILVVGVTHEFTGGPRHWRRRLAAV